MMYTNIVNSQDQALCHLFFHCCLEDDQFTDAGNYFHILQHTQALQRAGMILLPVDMKPHYYIHV